MPSLSGQVGSLGKVTATPNTAVLKGSPWARFTKSRSCVVMAVPSLPLTLLPQGLWEARAQGLLPSLYAYLSLRSTDSSCWASRCWWDK